MVNFMHDSCSTFFKEKQVWINQFGMSFMFVDLNQRTIEMKMRVRQRDVCENLSFLSCFIFVDKEDAIRIKIEDREDTST